MKSFNLSIGSLKTIAVFIFCFLVTFATHAEPPANTQPEKQTININLADAKTIASTLKGVGITKAEAIVDYRERYGEFAHLDELVAVKGIGKGTLSKNVHLLSLE